MVTLNLIKNGMREILIPIAKMRKLILVLSLVGLICLAGAFAYEYRTIYNPFTGKLDYHITGNFSGENISADYFFGNGSYLTGVSTNWNYNQTEAGQSVFLNLSGTNANQNLDIGDYNITVDWFKGNYFSGQPIEGYLGSGIIWAEEFDDNGLLNVSNPSGLDVTYSGFIMRLVKTDNSVKYCNITGDTVTVPDNTHSVYYVDSDCNVQHTSIQNYIATDLSPGGLADFFNAVSQSGNIGILEGTSLMNKEDIRVRRNTFKLTNLDVISGTAVISIVKV